MGWKDWPTWLKGGVILEIILVLVAILEYILQDGFGLLTSSTRLGVIFKEVFAILLIPPFMEVIGIITIYFIFGAFIGWLIGRAKNK